MQQGNSQGTLCTRPTEGHAGPAGPFRSDTEFVAQFGLCAQQALHIIELTYVMIYEILDCPALDLKAHIHALGAVLLRERIERTWSGRFQT